MWDSLDGTDVEGRVEVNLKDVHKTTVGRRNGKDFFEDRVPETWTTKEWTLRKRGSIDVSKGVVNYLEPSLRWRRISGGVKGRNLS